MQAMKKKTVGTGISWTWAPFMQTLKSAQG